MANPKSLSDLLQKGGARLSVLRSASAERAKLLDQVRAALPPKLAGYVVTAGIADEILTIGVTGGAWATRMRYLSDVLLPAAETASGLRIAAVRVRVVPPS